MPLIAKSSGGQDFGPVDAGMHHVICYGVVDLGTQPSNNPQFKATRKVCFLFELPEERIEFTKDGTVFNLPRGISTTYTLSLNSKGNLKKVLEGWRGRPFTPEELDGFDVFTVAGVNAFLNVIHTKKGDKTYANISAITPMPKSVKKLSVENPLLTFALPEDMSFLNFPANMPDWLRTKVEQSNEYQAFVTGKTPGHTQEPDDSSAFPTTDTEDTTVDF